MKDDLLPKAKSQLLYAAQPPLYQRVWRDPFLRVAFLVFGLMAGFQLALHLLQPPWLGGVNDWILFVLAWPEVIVLVALSWWFTRTRRPAALSWWLISAALFFFALRRTILLLMYDHPVFPALFPIPRWSNLFMLLQVICMFLAFLLLPANALPGQHWLVRLRVFLDSLLLMSAVTLTSWYFLLLPLAVQSGAPLAERATNLGYVILGLGLLFILLVLLTRERRTQLDRIVLGLLSVGVLLTLIGYFWLAVLDLHTLHATGAPPDAFWILGHLMFPLAALVQFRLAHWEPEPLVYQSVARVRWQDLLDGLRFMLPFVVALLASVITTLGALLAPTIWGAPLIALWVSAGVLLLMTVRQGVLFLERVQMRREQAAAQVRELALAEANAQMDTFVTMASHELKTPLTVLSLYQQRAMRRLHRLHADAALRPPYAVEAVQQCEQDLRGAEGQLRRQNRLIHELLDVSRIQAGRLELRWARRDLQQIVQEVVEEQREVWPGRSIRLALSAEGAAPIEADPDRLAEVVTNYLTNALCYSAEERPVEVGAQVEGQEVYVWVRDQGPGLPPGEDARIWERFYRAPGIAIQSGSGVGLGIGLYLCKTIVEQHAGRVGVESAPGAGSTFWLRLPLQRAAPE